ncbi:MAG: MBL fold metallo-hydrolase [Deltaproteobacteria bacterium]|nr:MBL fold metallo-hydrolase [Deltaproteobacteria bacterium]MBW2404422.1 MBL fold metallo-hydrolase [Deltaproteobacteria bacterium]
MAGRFFNLDGTASAAGLARVLKWQLGFHDEKRPRTRGTGVPVPAVSNDGKALRRATQDALTWIGHATFLIQLGGKSALIDPVMSQTLSTVVRRNVAPGLDWPALPKIDVVLVTHNHRDHMDAPTLKRLGSDPVYVVPRGLGRWFERAGLRRVVEMDWWQEEQIEGLHITFVPSQHWSRRGLTDMNATWWGGFVIERGGLQVYHSGDTAWFEGFSLIGERCGEIHAAMLPIGAYAPRWFMRAQHMDPEDAVRAFTALGAAKFVAMHWGTFKLTDEHLEEPPQLLREIWERSGLHDDRRLIPAIGETLLLDR